MNESLRYPELYSFLSAEFADADLEGREDVEVVRQCVSTDLVEWHRTILAEGNQVLSLSQFPWQEIANYANRYFETEAEARQWLTFILTTLAAAIEQADRSPL